LFFFEYNLTFFQKKKKSKSNLSFTLFLDRFERFFIHSNVSYITCAEDMRNVSYITCAEDMRGPIETVIRSGAVHRLIQFLLDESFPKLQVRRKISPIKLMFLLMISVIFDSDIYTMIQVHNIKQFVYLLSH